MGIRDSLPKDCMSRWIFAWPGKSGTGVCGNDRTDRLQGIRWRAWWKRSSHGKLPVACPLSFPGPIRSGSTTFLSPSLFSHHAPPQPKPCSSHIVSLLFCKDTSIPTLTAVLALLSAQDALPQGRCKAFFLTSLRPLPQMSSLKQRQFL